MGLSDSHRDLDWTTSGGEDDLDGSFRSTGSLFSASSDNTQSKLAQESKVKEITWKGKAAFTLLLLIVGAVSANVAFFLMNQEEKDLGELQYESIAERASIMALSIMKRKRLGLVTLSSTISGANPLLAEWPNIQVNHFEVIATNVMAMSNDFNISFAPIVTPEQVPSFENHSYDFYERNRSPEPFPEGTATSPFGQGIYAIDPITQERYHDITGETHWNSPNTILTPILHHCRGADSSLMSNLHADQIIGQMIDGMVECANHHGHHRVLQHDHSSHHDSSHPAPVAMDQCTILSGISPSTTGWTPYSSEEPWGLLIHPVYAQNSPETLSGIVLTSLLWNEIFNGAFANTVSGVYAVLQATDGSSYTYIIQEGQAVPVGKGDLHDSEYDTYGQEVLLTSKDRNSHNYFGEPEVSVHYKLILYPSEEFFASFSTSNPILSSVGSIMVLVITSGLFIFYDIFVRRDYLLKKDLLEAKRKFIRFVSHEVRTPLNSVHMGLTVLRGELEAKYGGGTNAMSDDDVTVDTLTSSLRRNTSGGLNSTVTKSDRQLVAMADEIAMNCNGAVDILNDFINFDKIETDKLSLELSVVRLFDQVESTSKEFKMVARNNKINLTIATPLSAKGKTPKECFTVGDSLRINHVFRNLIANALEKTPDDGKVEVQASWNVNSLKNTNVKSFVLKDGKKMKVHHNGFMKFVVSDTGKGMTQTQIRKLLHKGSEFNVNKLQAGNASGLGLWVAKGIVMRHGGTLTAHSHGLGKGSVFTVSLPTYDIEDPKPPKPKGIGGSTAPKDVLGILKVLVVDDAKMNLKLLMRLVSKKGHKVDGAEDGAIAVDKASKAMDEGADYDVILMDYQMPNMDGPTATRILRSKGCNAFICGVTGNVMAEDIKHFKKCGANAVLHKPAKIKALEDLWIEYGVRGEIPPAEGVHDGVIEEKPKRVQINATASSAYHDSGVSLSLSSLSIGLNDKDSPEPPGHKKATRVNMAGAVLSQSENSPEFPSSRRTNGTGDTAGTDDSDLWGSKLSDTFAN